MSLKYAVKTCILIMLLIILILLCVVGLSYIRPVMMTFFIEEEVSEEINYIVQRRSQAILTQDVDTLKNLYDLNIRASQWAFEHELRRMKYLQKWSKKQGVKFVGIQPNVMIRRSSVKGEGYSLNLTISTKYDYIYENEEVINSFRIGTHHFIEIEKREEGWIILREWYPDPFADSLHLDDIKTESIKEFILSQEFRDLSNIGDRRLNALKYADEFCGAAGEVNRGYNKKYINYNPKGGDCANYASQILYEGGRFKKNSIWNYDKGGSSAWVNAQAFKNYMINSGRASLVAYGDYNKVYKASYKLLPGDFVAYEKKGKVTHISVITGADSKGYSLVNSHNTDRYRVPWDLGWSNKGIKFWLVHVHF